MVVLFREVSFLLSVSESELSPAPSFLASCFAVASDARTDADAPSFLEKFDQEKKHGD